MYAIGCLLVLVTCTYYLKVDTDIFTVCITRAGTETTTRNNNSIKKRGTITATDAIAGQFQIALLFSFIHRHHHQLLRMFMVVNRKYSA